MSINFSSSEARGPDLSIDCPACGAVGVPGLSYQIKERFNFFYIHKTAWVICSACERHLFSRLLLDDLVLLPPHQVSDHLMPMDSFSGRVMAICAMILSPMPALGLVVAVIAVLINRKAIGWSRIASYIGLLLSLAFSLLLAILLLLEQLGMFNPA